MHYHQTQQLKRTVAAFSVLLHAYLHLAPSTDQGAIAARRVLDAAIRHTEQQIVLTALASFHFARHGKAAAYLARTL